METHRAQQDEILARMDDHTAWYDGTLRQRDGHMDYMIDMLASCHSAAAH
jgi:hypothetical protein